MAGSYGHLRDDNTGNLRLDLVENKKDMGQALEECFHLIQILSGGEDSVVNLALGRYHAWSRGEIPRELLIADKPKNWGTWADWTKGCR